MAGRKKALDAGPPPSASPDDVLVAIYAWRHGLYPEFGHCQHGTAAILRPTLPLFDFLRADADDDLSAPIHYLKTQNLIRSELTHSICHRTGERRLPFDVASQYSKQRTDETSDPELETGDWYVPGPHSFGATCVPDGDRSGPDCANRAIITSLDGRELFSHAYRPTRCHRCAGFVGIVDAICQNCNERTFLVDRGFVSLLLLPKGVKRAATLVKTRPDMLELQGVRDHMQANFEEYIKNERATFIRWADLDRREVGETTAASSAQDAAAIDSLHDEINRLKQMERDCIQALYEHKMIGSTAPHQPSQDVLARWVGYKWDTSFKNALSTVAKAGFLDNGRHHGKRGGYYLLSKGERAGQLLAAEPSR